MPPIQAQLTLLNSNMPATLFRPRLLHPLRHRICEGMRQTLLNPASMELPAPIPAAAMFIVKRLYQVCFYPLRFC
jgi:hypothetical protein